MFNSFLLTSLFLSLLLLPLHLPSSSFSNWNQIKISDDLRHQFTKRRITVSSSDKFVHEFCCFEFKRKKRRSTFGFWIQFKAKKKEIYYWVCGFDFNLCVLLSLSLSSPNPIFYFFFRSSLLTTSVLLSYRHWIRYDRLFNMECIVCGKFKIGHNIGSYSFGEFFIRKKHFHLFICFPKLIEDISQLRIN